MRIDNLLLNEFCTGCQACYNLCPANAIEMNVSLDGFLYPKINYNKCVDCGLCARVCMITEKKERKNPLKIYSVQAKDKNLLKKVSSGGVFPLLANKILNDKGAVVGAAFDAKEKEVLHYTTDQVPLERLLRSKYVQSDIRKIYCNVGEELQKGRKVLFSGTPCQIRGLRNYLIQKSISNENLLLVDFMCHGVPSPGFLKEILNHLEKENKSSVIDVTFREKDLGWKKQVIKYYFKNGKELKKVSKDSEYYYFFLQDYSLRNSCYKCDEYNKHLSDLTLADDWLTKRNKDNNGTSLVFIWSEKGNEIYQKIIKEVNQFEVSDEFKTLERYSHERYSILKKEKWTYLWNKKGFDYVCRIFYRKVKIKRDMELLIYKLKLIVKNIFNKIQNIRIAGK